MSLVSLFLRRGKRGYEHWCPGCEVIHTFYDAWYFDGEADAPTFLPSMKIEGTLPPPKIMVTGHAPVSVKTAIAEAFRGEPEDFCCHYFLTRGQLQFQADCTHDLASRTVALPVLPKRFRDAA